MAEAHQAVAFSFHVTHEGVKVNYDKEMLNEIWISTKRSYKRRMARFQNNFKNQLYPASPASLMFVISLVTGLTLLRFDITRGLLPWLHSWIGTGMISLMFVSIVFSIIAWFMLIQLLRNLLKLLLQYKGWMYERTGKLSWPSMIWLGIIRVLTLKRPMLYSFQGAMPRLPLPSVKKTLERHLKSVRPLLNEDEYNKMVKASDEFETSIAPKLQRYLMIKSWFSSNYVTDWWEEYVYLRSRGPIMVNSNYYGIDTIFLHPTNIQAARAANQTASALEFRRLLDRQELKPIQVFGVPLCSAQYERLFNTTRVPGETTDILRHWQNAKHVAVYCKGCWYKVPIHNGRRILTPAELE